MAKVVVVQEEEKEEDAPEPKTWYNSISSSQIDTSLSPHSSSNNRYFWDYFPPHTRLLSK